jgi:rsbT co-antagonist protein RsbR
MPAIIRDMSEQKQNETKLQRLAAVIDNSTDFIGMSTLEGQAIYINKAGRELIGLEPEQDISQMLIPEFHLPEDMPFIEQQIMPTIMQQGNWRSEFRLKHLQTGEAIPIDYNLFIVNDEQTEEPIALAAVMRDLTAQKQAEQERATLQDQIIEAQRLALRELSSPLIPISERVVIMPLIGTIDTQRAQEIMETLLEGVANHHADIAIIDITGVKVVDTQVANGLIQAAQAARLLGAQVILTGIGPAMAQTLVHLGVDLSGMMTLSTLQHGIEYSLTRNALGNGSKKQADMHTALH